MKYFLVLSGAALLSLAAMNPCPAADNTASLNRPVTKVDTESSVLPEVDVVSKALDVSRDEIVPSLGATKYSMDSSQISSQPQGENAPFSQAILQFPGVAQDSYGQLHLRGEHANLQYRINDVLLSEGISGFGQELSSRFIDHLSLLTGALPAQFGYRTAGIVDIQTKSGASLSGGEASLYGGSYDTINPSFEYGGTSPKLTWYFTGSYLHNGLGIENPTSSSTPIHDDTNQFKGFAYFSYLIDDTSRLNLILSAAHSDFQIPNNPGQPQNFTLNGVPSFDSANLNENQTEQNYYGILSYQKKLDTVDFQVSAFSRYSAVLFMPDNVGDLIFNGVSSRVDRSIISNGIQGDGSWKLNDSHTLRAGLTFTEEHAVVNTSNLVFPADSMGNQIPGSDPFNIVDDSSQQAYLFGVYLQDEWKIFDKLTLNFGGRFDVSDAFISENQFSPRVNLVYLPTDKTTMHLGYARYFTPPPLELVSQESVAKYAGTTNANPDGITQSSPVKSERSHYFDAGITQKITQDLQVGIDGYYKIAQNQLDEGQFGQAVIYSPFNYAQGRVYGVELTANYEKNGFSIYGNIAYSRAMGEQISSGEFQFSQAELNYIANHWVFLDHDQRITASLGASYTWKGTRISADSIYGSGLRKGFANTENGQAYFTMNLGIEHTFKIPQWGEFKLRFDVVNLFDQIYELRDGSGIGVSAPQYGARRGFYAGVGFTF